MASDTTLALGDDLRVRRLSVFVPRSSSSWRSLPYPRRPVRLRANPISVGFYVDAGRQCAFGNCDDHRLHRLKRECLREGGGQS